MKIHDKKTLSVAEAVTEVLEGTQKFKISESKMKELHALMKKGMKDPKKIAKELGLAGTKEVHDAISQLIKSEAEVQPANKDFVALHTIDKKDDPEKERQVEGKEEDDDVEEGNAFGQAVTDAKKAGKKKFKFQGKEYKVEGDEVNEIEIDPITGKLIGAGAPKKESVELDEMSPADKKRFNSIRKEMDKAQKKIDAAVKKGDAKTVNKLADEIHKLRMQIVNFYNESVELDEKVAPNLTKVVNIRREMVKVQTKIDKAVFDGDVKTVDKLSDQLHKLRMKLVNFYNESVNLKEFNRLKPDDVRDAYGEIELKYRSSSDIRDAESVLKKAGINVRKDGDTLEVDSDSPAFKKARITSSFDSSKREKLIMKVLGESVEKKNSEIEELTEETFNMFFGGYDSDWYYFKQDAKKMRAKLTNVETQFGGDYYFTMDTTKSNLKKLLKKYGDLELEESVNEAVKPEDFVKGGNTKVTQREIDKILFKLFTNTKLAKAVEASKAYKAGEKDAGKKKNPYKVDTADYHLYTLATQASQAS